MDIAAYLRSRGGFARRSTLIDARIPDSVLRSEVRAGRIIIVRQGWYAAPDADPDAMAAVRAGGRLSCLSALRFHGVWVLDDRQLHVACPSGRGVRHDGLRVHTGSVRTAGNHPAVESALEALERLARCGSREAFVTSADSAVNRSLVSIEQVQAAVAVSVRTRRLVDAVDGRCESGIESLARLALRGRGVRLAPQAVSPGVGRVDLLAGDRLVIELDSWKWHSDREAFEKDRRRDLALAARGYLPARVSYRRVLEDWAAVQAELVQIVRAGEHRWHAAARRLAARNASDS